MFLAALPQCATFGMYTRTGPPASRHQSGPQMALLQAGRHLGGPTFKPVQGRGKGTEKLTGQYEGKLFHG